MLGAMFFILVTSAVLAVAMFSCDKEAGLGDVVTVFFLSFGVLASLSGAFALYHDEVTKNELVKKILLKSDKYNKPNISINVYCGTIHIREMCDTYLVKKSYSYELSDHNISLSLLRETKTKIVNIPIKPKLEAEKNDS